ncbi:hypothetical protein EST38_g2745 [Candolleomyces aberdarensis]|uniref:Conidiation-specific protein 6 n=1 Tax=Candolleomyces aberdarensis TaxID=2316362 RepID=A0A4Q2DTT1_9AGAR|nr:hypothetical protein EST38_g2745 [Candolleomyces aberdarensis]
MSLNNQPGIVPDNVWPDRDEDYVPGDDANLTKTAGQGPASNLRRSGEGEYVGMDMHEKADEDDYGNVGRSRGAKATENAGEESRVIGGYKATLKNPRVSDEAKAHAQDVLQEKGVDF